MTEEKLTSNTLTPHELLAAQGRLATLSGVLNRVSRVVFRARPRANNRSHGTVSREHLDQAG